MKTVMKKIFSLMLVAVLLVGAMPFQTFAAETTLDYDLTLTAGTNYSVDALVAEKYSGSSTNYWVHRTAPSAEDYLRGASFDAVEGGTYTLYIVETTPDPIPEPEPQTCATCGKAAHEGLCEGQCGTCMKLNGHEPTCAATYYVECCGAEKAKGHLSTCSTQQVTVTFIDQVNGTSVTDICYPGEVINLTTPNWYSGYEFVGWKLSNGSSYLGSTYQIPANAGGSSIVINAHWNRTTVTATYPLKVYARLHTGDVVTGVVEIHRNDNMLSGDKILNYLKHEDTQATLWSIVRNHYSGYTWSGNIYNAYGEEVATDNITTVNGSKSVYINLHSQADQVLVYVHTVTSTKDYDRIVELDGYKVGDVVSSSEVRTALKKYYGSGITVKMFDAKGFNDYLNNKPNTQTDYVTVTNDPTAIHVRLYMPSSSSSATADSSNPKTGDMIFAPAAVLGLSATALAVLFFLNKKRAV